MLSRQNKVKLLNKFFKGDRILLLILLLALFIRVWGLGADPFFDETIWTGPVKETLSGSPFYIKWIPHPPLSVLFFSFFALIGGVSFSALRMMPLFTGLVTIAVSYYLAKSMYGKKAAALSALLMAVIFYHVWMSLWIDSDGSVLTMFCVMTLFSFHKFEKTGGRRWLALTGLCFGLALLSKYPALLMLPVLLLHDWFSNRLSNLKPLIISALIGFAVFAIFPAFTLAIGEPGIFTETLKWGTGNLGRSDATDVLYAYALSMGKLVVFLFQYGTSILCFLPLYGLGKREKKEYMLLTYVLLFLLFFTFVLPGGAKARYIMPVVPVLAILASKNILTMVKKVGKRDLAVLACIFTASLALFILLNAYGSSETFNSKNMQPELLLENSLFWYSGFACSPFAVRIDALLFIAAASVCLFLLSFRYGRKPLLALIAVSLAFNAVIVAQSFYPTFGPNLKNTVTDMMAYYNASGMDCRLYATEKVFTYYSQDAEFIEIPLRTEIKGCLLAVNVQGFVESETFRDAVSGCQKAKTFYSNGFEFGYIYNCE